MNVKTFVGICRDVGICGDVGICWKCSRAQNATSEKADMQLILAVRFLRSTQSAALEITEQLSTTSSLVHDAYRYSYIARVEDRIESTTCTASLASQMYIFLCGSRGRSLFFDSLHVCKMHPTCTHMALHGM